MNSKPLFLTGLEAGSPRAWCQQSWCLARTCFLDGHLFPVSSDGGSGNGSRGFLYQGILTLFMKTPPSGLHHLPQTPPSHVITLGM